MKRMNFKKIVYCLFFSLIFSNINAQEIGKVCIHFNDGLDSTYKPVPCKSDSASNSTKCFELILFVDMKDTILPVEISASSSLEKYSYFNENSEGSHKLFFPEKCFLEYNCFTVEYDGIKYTIPFFEGYRHCVISPTEYEGYVFATYFNKFRTFE
jgi:hypothetical protein